VSRSYASRVDEPPTLFLSDMQMVFDAQAVAERLDVEQRVNAASPPLVKICRGLCRHWRAVSASSRPDAWQAQA